jgi:sarcosine oxidase / L-pipecolate oxidase
LRIIVVGAGIFGVTAALELTRRGHRVELFDPGPLPNPHAASTDISKFVRMDYGADDLYTELGELCLERWRDLNVHWNETLYNETGLVVMGREQMRAGSFEYESFVRLERRGTGVVRLGSRELKARFPEWAAERYPDGYYNPRAGWVASGRVVARYLEEARAAGVSVHEGSTFEALLEGSSRVDGIATADGRSHLADLVVTTLGAWTSFHLPGVERCMWACAQPVFHFRVEDPSAFQPPRFACWTADISRTGWYGFTALDDGTLKVANHGPGRRLHPDDQRRVGEKDLETCRAFLATTFPRVATAQLLDAHLCFYSDSWDGNFYIDHHPDRPGLVVAAGDSGHAFKFAPAIGEIISDVVERRANRFAERFRWRQPGARSAEDARFVERDAFTPEQRDTTVGEEGR